MISPEGEAALAAGGLEDEGCIPPPHDVEIGAMEGGGGIRFEMLPPRFPPRCTLLQSDFSEISRPAIGLAPGTSCPELFGTLDF